MVCKSEQNQKSRSGTPYEPTISKNFKRKNDEKHLINAQINSGGELYEKNETNEKERNDDSCLTLKDNYRNKSDKENENDKTEQNESKFSLKSRNNCENELIENFNVSNISNRNGYDGQVDEMKDIPKSSLSSIIYDDKISPSETLSECIDGFNDEKKEGINSELLFTDKSQAKSLSETISEPKIDNVNNVKIDGTKMRWFYEMQRAPPSSIASTIEISGSPNASAHRSLETTLEISGSENATPPIVLSVIKRKRTLTFSSKQQSGKRKRRRR